MTGNTPGAYHEACLRSSFQKLLRELHKRLHASIEHVIEFDLQMNVHGQLVGVKPLLCALDELEPFVLPLKLNANCLSGLPVISAGPNHWVASPGNDIGSSVVRFRAKQWPVAGM